MAIAKLYQCVFCEKEFTRRSWYDKHKCTKKKRFAEANNLTTIMAQKLFVHWMGKHHLKRNLKVSPMTEFVASPFYNAFVKLSTFCQTGHVVSAHKYLDWLIQKNIPERNWTHAKNLDAFREFTRDHEDVAEQVEKSFRHIRAWAVKTTNPVAEFFNKIDPIEALIMVRHNQLMPWVLLGFDTSVQKLVSRMGQEQTMALDEFINLEYWLTKLEEHPDKKATAQKLSEQQLVQST